MRRARAPVRAPRAPEREPATPSAPLPRTPPRRLVEDAVLCRRDDATERLLERAQLEREKLEAAKAGGAAPVAAKGAEWREKPVRERLTYSLIKGIPDFIDGDVE